MVQQIDREKLLRLLTNQLGGEELRTLCFTLDIDFDNLSGEGKEAKARELIDYCQRRKSLSILATGITRQRPDLQADLKSVLGDAWEIHRLGLSLKTGDTDSWLSKNTVLFIAYESPDSVRTMIRTDDGRATSGLMPLDVQEIGHFAEKTRDIPKLIFRYTEASIGDYGVNLGHELYNLAISQPVKQVLKKLSPSQIDLVIEPDLQYVPWELMYDGDEFLFLKHDVGRCPVPPRLANGTYKLDTYSTDNSTEKLKFLIIAPEQRERGFPPLGLGDSDEVRQIVQVCSEAGIVPHILTDATRNAVIQLFYDGQDVVHYIGHAMGKGLVVSDGILSHDLIADSTSQHRRCLFFLNACETATIGATLQPTGYDLALHNLTVISPTSWIGYDPAIQIATTFYRHALNGDTFGKSLRLARQQAFHSYPHSWWGYILYGEPSNGIQ